jgi:hypothetical protein
LFENKIISGAKPFTEMSEVQVRGYSERGMINSICYEIRYSPNGPKLLQDLGLCTFPLPRPEFRHFRSAMLHLRASESAAISSSMFRTLLSSRIFP